MLRRLRRTNVHRQLGATRHWFPASFWPTLLLKPNLISFFYLAIFTSGFLTKTVCFSYLPCTHGEMSRLHPLHPPWLHVTPNNTHATELTKQLCILLCCQLCLKSRYCPLRTLFQAHASESSSVKCLSACNGSSRAENTLLWHRQSLDLYLRQPKRYSEFNKKSPRTLDWEKVGQKWHYPTPIIDRRYGEKLGREQPAETTSR
jgi:hypothetical protein